MPNYDAYLIFFVLIHVVQNFPNTLLLGEGTLIPKRSSPQKYYYTTIICHTHDNCTAFFQGFDGQ